MAKVFRNVLLKSYDGKTIQTAEKKGDSDEIKLVDTKLLSVFYIILNGSPIQTMNDSIQGMRLAEALDAAKKNGGNIEIEEEPYTWLKSIAEKVLPPVFRINASIVYKHICEEFEKPSEPVKGKGK